MTSNAQHELYQQVILDHNKNPRNFKKLENPTHFAEGYNPLCGDHLFVYLNVGSDGIIHDIAFDGSGCAISKSSASMMTQSLKGKTLLEAKKIFEEFHNLVLGKLKPDTDPHRLGKLAIFSGIWQFPSRIKCATLSWHTLNGAIQKVKSVSTES